MIKKTHETKEPDEWRQQAALFLWAEEMLDRYPELDLLEGSLNGVKLTKGQAIKAKRCGMKKGVPDLHLPVASRGFHSLYIELKKKKGGVEEPEQIARISRLNDEGNYALFCYGIAQAIDTIKWYLG